MPRKKGKRSSSNRRIGSESSSRSSSRTSALARTRRQAMSVKRLREITNNEKFDKQKIFAAPAGRVVRKKDEDPRPSIKSLLKQNLALPAKPPEARRGCTKDKQRRRAVILATGKGGLHGRRGPLKPRRKC